MSELHDLTALEQAAAIRSGQLSPVDLVEHYLSRIDRLDRAGGHGEGVGAFVTVTADSAREQARAAEAAAGAARRAGNSAALPPLHGVPTAIKDLNLTAGVPTKLGSPAFADFVPAIDDHVVRVLREAGTISLGKTNTPEFGAPCYTEPDPSIAPPARTPYDRTRSAGGSSGGAGAAVAAGFVPAAQGSDGGGSLRIPGSVNGLVGLKVSRGRISNGPLQGDVGGLSWNGPLARTIADAAALLDAMAVVPQAGDPHWAAPLPAGRTFLQAAVAGSRGEVPTLRIGRYLRNVLDAPVHPDCVAAWEGASGSLADLGHEVIDIEPPALTGLFDTFLVLWSVLFASLPVPPEREGMLRPLTRWLREQGRAHPATAFTSALATVQLASRQAIGATGHLDAVLTPTLAQPPALVGGLRDDADPAGDFARQAEFTPYTAIYNTTGQPAVNLPLHWTPDGLPIGVQLVGRPGGEATLIRLGAQLEAARPWAHRHPPLW
ncbi:MAG: amidase [Mycobacteriales bacterium]